MIAQHGSLFSVDVTKKKKKKILRFEENFCVANQGNLYGIAGYIEGDVFFGFSVFRFIDRRGVKWQHEQWKSSLIGGFSASP